MLPRPHHAVGGRKLELTLGIYASSVRPPSDNDLGPYRNWQTVLEEAPRGRPTRSPLTPHRAPDDSATAAGEQLSLYSVGPTLQWRCRLGSRYTSDTTAPKRWEIPRHYLPPLWCRDPSITPHYPGVPDLTVTQNTVWQIILCRRIKK